MRVLVQAGQWSLGAVVVVVVGVVLLDEVWDVEASGVEKVIGMRVFRERGCGEVGEEPGQREWSFGVLEEGVFVVVVVVEGVSAGTQKEGRVGLEDWIGRLLVVWCLRGLSCRECRRGCTCSSSIAFRAFARSSLAFCSICSSSNSNFRFTPRPSVSLFFPSFMVVMPFWGLRPAVPPSNPIMVFSNSRILLSFSSSALFPSFSASSLLLRSSSFSSL